MSDLQRDLAWAQAHAVALMTASGAVLVAVIVSAVWLAARRRSLARTLRGIAIPLVLLWEAQGLYGVALRVRVPHSLAWVVAGVTTAVVLTFAAYAHEHYERHGTLGPNGRAMWMVAVPMGIVVAANSRSPAEVGLRLILPLLSVLAFRAAYQPDEPAGHVTKQGSWRITPRRIGIALGLIDPSETDLATVHAERRIRLLTSHAAGYHRGHRRLKGWHRRRFEALAILADDDMIAEAARRVRRVHEGLAATSPDQPDVSLTENLTAAARSASPDPHGQADPEPDGMAADEPDREPDAKPLRKPSKAAARKMTGADLVPYVERFLGADPLPTKDAIMKEFHVGPPKAGEALDVMRRKRVHAVS